MSRWRTFGSLISIIYLWSPLANAQGNQPDYSSQPPTGTTDSNGNPTHQSGTITSQNGNTSNIASPTGTDPSAGPANRNPYNDPTFRDGTPGTNGGGNVHNFTNSRGQGNTETLGTAAPAQTGVTPGLGGMAGQATSAVGEPNPTNGSIPGNPGPIGNSPTPNTAATTGNVGAAGSGSSGIPGSISSSGTHGNKGSGF